MVLVSHLWGDEIGKFCEFLANIQSVAFKDNRKINITDEELRKIALTTHQAKNLVNDNEELFAEIIRHSITKEDVVALGYRKRQLEIFQRMLEEEPYFEELKGRKNCNDESLWQQFFEKNPWIFGYGLNYVYSSPLDEKRLEQVVRGYNVTQSGKRVDALLKSKAIVSTLCFVEIKTHKTALVAKTPYRKSCWLPSNELSGAVAQIQGSVSSATESLFGKLHLTDTAGFPTGEEVFNYKPKSIVIAGNLSQFCGEHGVNQDQLRSFELFRKNTIQPEIITFDELYQRASQIVETSEC